MAGGGTFAGRAGHAPLHLVAPLQRSGRRLAEARGTSIRVVEMAWAPEIGGPAKSTIVNSIGYRWKLPRVVRVLYKIYVLRSIFYKFWCINSSTRWNAFLTY